jgi:predicted transposase YbfD/YdcC
MAEIQRIGFGEIVQHVEELEDPRSTVNRKHPLVSVVVIALMAVLAGANGPTAIARWAALKKEFLLEVLENEITAIPQRLRLVDIKGAIITIDAMETQKAIASQIVEAEADYVLALKANQETLHQGVIDHLVEQSETGFANAGASQHVTTETGHGREETRSYIQMPVPEDLPGLKLWKGLKSIGLVLSEWVRDGKETVEIRYFISSLEVDVKRFAHAIRSHWSIENSCHWCLDITYREDESRIREKHLRENFAWLNRLTLSLLKQHGGRGSVAMKRRSCGWSDVFLMEVLIGSTN